MTTEITIHAAKQMVDAFASMGAPGYATLAERGEHFVGRAAVKSNPVTHAWAKRTKPRKKQCYMNAAKFVLEHPDAKYYEGYWSAHVIPVHHAWCVLDGAVIDFTAEACERYIKRNSDVLGPIPAPHEQDYYGIHIPTAFVREMMIKTRIWGDVMGRYLWEIREPDLTPAARDA